MFLNFIIAQYMAEIKTNPPRLNQQLIILIDIMAKKKKKTIQRNKKK